MSRIWVDRIEAMAKRRIARTAQVEALPPQPERHQANHWEFNRQPFVHARLPGLMSRSVGKGDPIKEALASSPQLQQFISETFNNYDLQELLVSPVLPAEVYDAIAFEVATYDPATPDANLMALYEPAGYQIDSTLFVPAGTAIDDGPSSAKFTGPSLPAPCILKEISFYPGDWTWVTGAGAGVSATLYIDGYGSLFDFANAAELNNHNRGSTQKGINRWIIAGSLTPFYEIRVDTGTTNVACYGSPYIMILVEPLIRKR